jgi:uncharacterized protein YuzE
MGGSEVKISYDDKTDLLYLRFDERKQEDASLHLDLERLLPVHYGASKA